jgi:hypothetical protein
MFDDHGPCRCIAVADGVGVFLALLSRLRHQAVRDEDSGDALVLGFLFSIDQNAEVGSVGKQALFAGLDGIHQAFAGEGIAFEYVEAAAVER